MAVLGKIIGGVGGFMLGGPLGAAAGVAAGAGADQFSSAQRTIKREAQVQGEITRSNDARAKKLEGEQRGQREQSLQQLSSERSRAARGRVRGGLFGDAAPATPTLGG